MLNQSKHHQSSRLRIMFMKKIKPETLQRLRKNANMTREELASYMDWSIGTVVNRETKDCKISLTEFEKLIMVTTTSPEDRARRKQVFKSFSDQITGLIDSMGTK